MFMAQLYTNNHSPTAAEKQQNDSSTLPELDKSVSNTSLCLSQVEILSMDKPLGCCEWEEWPD